MKYKRWFRVLVCLVLVCALIVNISPVRARATAIVAGLTVAEIAGYLALISGFVLGLVIGVSASLINKIISAFSRWVMSW